MIRPLTVAKDDSVWRWRCRVWLCEQSEWTPSHRRAIGDGHDHLKQHERFGFKPGSKW